MIKGVHQLQRIVSKNSIKRFVDLLEAGIGTTKRRHLKKKFKIKTCKDSARARAIKLHLAGLELDMCEVRWMKSQPCRTRPRLPQIDTKDSN